MLIQLVGWEKMVLITRHRRNDFSDVFIRISKAIKELTQKYSDIDFIYPMHLNLMFANLFMRYLEFYQLE